MNFLELHSLITQLNYIKDLSIIPDNLNHINIIEEILAKYSFIMPQMYFYNIQVDHCVDDYIYELTKLKTKLIREKERFFQSLAMNNLKLKKDYNKSTLPHNFVMDNLKNVHITNIVNDTNMNIERPYNLLQGALRVRINEVTITTANCKFLLDLIMNNVFPFENLNNLDISNQSKMITQANNLMTEFKDSIYLYNVLYVFFSNFLNSEAFRTNQNKQHIILAKNNLSDFTKRKIQNLINPEKSKEEAEGEEGEGIEGREGGEGEEGAGGIYEQFGGAPPPLLVRGSSLKMIHSQPDNIDLDDVVNKQITIEDFYDFIIKNMADYKHFISNYKTSLFTQGGSTDATYFDFQFNNFFNYQNNEYLHNLIYSIENEIKVIMDQKDIFNISKASFLKTNDKDIDIIKDNLIRLTNIIKQLNDNSNTTNSTNLYKKETNGTQADKKKLADAINKFITLFNNEFTKMKFQLDKSTIKGMQNSLEINIELQKLIEAMNPGDLNDTHKLLEFISQVNSIDETTSTFGTDILDERRVCGERDGEQIDGEKCINIITKCLSGNPDKCLAEFNELNFDKDINLKTMEYSVALNIAKTLGFDMDTVTNAINKIKQDYPTLEISPKLIIIFDAIKAKIDYVDLKTYTPKFESIEKKMAIPLRDVGRQTGGQTGGGNMNNYNNFIINLDALKKNLTMKGGSNNSIIVKKNLYYLKQLLKDNGKQIDTSDLNKINRLIDKLQIGEHIINKIDIVITGLTRAINEKSVYLTDPTLAPELAYQMLKDLYDKSKDKQAKNLQKVGTIVSLFHGLIPALGYRIP